MNDKIGIIGGGPIGIGTGRFFASKNKEVEIIEATSDFGGLWSFDSPAGKVYKSTHLISSKKNTQFRDYPIPESYPHYPNHHLFLSYLRAMAKEGGLYEKTIFSTKVVHVVPEDKLWRVSLSNGEEKLYRDLIVANGRLNTPLYPDYAKLFTGVNLHSADYRDPLVFTDKRVLVVGTGNSGCDIAVDAVPFAKKVMLSMRRGYHFMPKFHEGMPTQDWLMTVGKDFSSNEKLWIYIKKKFKEAGYDGVDYGLPEPDHEIYEAHPIMNSLVLYYIGQGDIEPKKDIKNIIGQKVIFTDGSEEEVDIILYATGYAVNFPFFVGTELEGLNDDLNDLFIYMFSRNYNNLIYLGFINSASGLGNLANAGGKLLESYYQARDKNTQAYQTFCRLKQGPNPDIGQGEFYQSHRHKQEVNLWKYLKTLSYLTNMFNPT